VSPLSVERNTPLYSVPAKIYPLLFIARASTVPPKGPLVCYQKFCAYREKDISKNTKSKSNFFIITPNLNLAKLL